MEEPAENSASLWRNEQGTVSVLWTHSVLWTSIGLPP